MGIRTETSHALKKMYRAIDGGLDVTGDGENQVKI